MFIYTVTITPVKYGHHKASEIQINLDTPFKCLECAVNIYVLLRISISNCIRKILFCKCDIPIVSVLTVSY